MFENGTIHKEVFSLMANDLKKRRKKIRKHKLKKLRKKMRHKK